MDIEHTPTFFNLLNEISERIPRIQMKWQLIGIGFCITILILGLSFVRPHVEVILDILLVPCIIFGCYFGYNILVIRKECKKILEEEDRE